jgi:predicted  nucleic acid-binding Zn-ribbon protein
MLNRNDLVKQFELVVKQEIKNHNDSLLASNLAINEMKSQVKDLSDRLDARVAQFENAKTWKYIYIDELRDFFEKEKSVWSSKFSDAQSNFILIMNELNKLKQNADKYNDNYNKLVEDFKTTKEWISSLNQNLNGNSASLRQEMQSMLSNMVEKLTRMKNEILSIPSEAKQVRNELEAKLDIAKVDRDGIMKEIAVCKKTTYVNEKLIENIYTLIDRLDKRISP